jgi:hypothetical protein
MDENPKKDIDIGLCHQMKLFFTTLDHQDMKKPIAPH